MKTSLHLVGSVRSTSDVAFEELAAGRAGHGDAYRAETQTAGRGRLGRRWESAPGEGLYLSLVWAPAQPPAHPAAITMAAGLALRDAAVELGLGKARLKWPNDVLVEDRKLAGILVESKDARPSAFVVGVGLNVGQRSFPAELTAERPVTSLALEGLAADLDTVTEVVLAHLGRRLDQIEALGGQPGSGRPPGVSAIERDYLVATGLRGAQVRVRRGTETFEGFLEDINLLEGICLRRADGWLAKVPVEHAADLETIA